CSTATAFQSYAWLESWWRSYGRPGQLVLVLVRRAGRLVAAAPLMRRHRFGIPVLTPLGVGISDFTDVLIDDSCVREAAGHLAQELAGVRGWQAIDLPEVPDPSATAHLLDAWPRPTWTVPGSVCMELAARPMRELIATLPGATAHTRRKKHRKIQAAGIETRTVGQEFAREAVAALLRLHEEQWRGRGMNPEHGRARFATHMGRAVPAMVERGQAHLVEYRLDSDVVAVELLLVGHRMLGAYLYGFRPDLRRRIDVTQLLLGTDLEIAQRLGRPVLSLLRGNEPYKRQWRPRERLNNRVLLAGHRPSATLYAAAVRDHRRLAQVAKTRLPVLRTAGRRLRACLPSSM
ncbi:MAG TPA: GNAT family N-acetyltransferase, partial [Micromonosporaceae bacterium]|nr:GNAT family N-acetyltransferase [Micromonosporaceae bacterium]